MTKEQLIKEIVQMQKKIAGLEEVVCYLKSTDEKLQESEERYRAIFELAADSIVLIDAETGMLVDFNKKAHENLNFTREEFEKLKISDFEVVESEEEVQRHFKKIVDEGSDSFETKHRKKGGELCDIQVSSKAISIRGKDFIQSIWMNISNLKRVEEALRESEEKYRTLFNSSLVGSYLVESGGKILDTNEAGAALLGFDNPEDMIGKSILDFYKNPEDRTKIFSEIESNDNVSFELELLKKDGSEVIAFISTALITFGGGKATLTSGIDITHLKRIETALRDSETKYRTLFEDSKDPIFIITRAGDFVNVNQSGLELFGYTRDELIGDRKSVV